MEAKNQRLNSNKAWKVEGREIFRVVTFGDGGAAWTRAAKRLSREVTFSNLLSGIDVATLGSDLLGEEFSRRVSKRWLQENRRGSGYWVWKPFLIRNTLLNLGSEEEGVLYLDAGCTFNSGVEASETLRDYLQKTGEMGTLFFELECQPEFKWSKSDLFKRFGLEGKAFTHTNQRHSTAHFWARSSNTMDFLDEWIELSLEDNFRYLDDSKSLSADLAGFVEHRHDQSILSLLSKAKGLTAIGDTTWHHPDWSASGSASPIWATRNKSAVSIHDTRVIAKVMRKTETAFSKLLK